MNHLKNLRILFLVLFLGMISLSSLSQRKQRVPADGIRIQWRPKEIYYQGKDQTRSLLVIKISDPEKLPARGWTLFFNFSENLVVPVNNHLKASRKAGNLWQLKPDECFKSAENSDSVFFEMITNGLVDNITEGPSGFFIVFDNAPNQGLSIPSTIKPYGTFLVALTTKHPEKNADNPVEIYNENTKIKDIPLNEFSEILPTPIEYKLNNEVSIITPETLILFDPCFENQAVYLANELSKVLTRKPRISSSSAAGVHPIHLKFGDQKASAYSLMVNKTGITISASTPQSIFYGIQSLKCLIPPTNWKTKQKAIQLKGVEVYDEPRFGYRSLMLDVARNFQPKEIILKLLDLMSLYKLNVFHFHFSDDEGWRLEIPSLPELTEIGGKRGYYTDSKTYHLNPAWGSGPDSTSLYGSGYYSRKDFIEILKYATDRYISVIPEIESPGHSMAAVKSMTARYQKYIKEGKTFEANRFLLNESNDTTVRIRNSNVMNIAMPSVYNFIEKVTDEVIAMYKEAGAPLETIHYGGDEVPGGVWQNSPAFHGLKNTEPSVLNPDDLWYYYFRRLNNMAKKRNLYISGWEEIGMRKTKLDGKPFYLPNPNFTDDNFQVHVWKNEVKSGNEDLAYRLANAGYKVVLACASNLYFDLAYTTSFFEPGLHWAGYIDVDKPFSFIPFEFMKNITKDIDGKPLTDFNLRQKSRLTEYGKSNIVGVQGLLWGEHTYNTDLMEYMLIPKILGLAETAWTKNPEWATEKDTARAAVLYDHALSVFLNAIGKRELPRLSYYNGGFNYRIPLPGLKINNGKIVANIQTPGLTIRYTIDGKEPTTGSAEYTTSISHKGVFRAAAFDARGRRGRITEISNDWPND